MELLGPPMTALSIILGGEFLNPDCDVLVAD